MREIKLNNIKFTIIDDEYFDYINQWKWFWDGRYCTRTDKNGKKIYLHRVINKTPVGLLTDHINGNKLDNRKCNLRTVTYSENFINMPKKVNNTSGHKGVSFEKFSNSWRAFIGVNGKCIRLGRFKKIEDAIYARKMAENLYYAKIIFV
jgi:hypothetical protein